MVFPEDALSRTLKVYPELSESKLKTELSLIYCKEEFRSSRAAVDLLQLFMENNLEEYFKRRKYDEEKREMIQIKTDIVNDNVQKL